MSLSSPATPVFEMPRETSRTVTLKDVAASAGVSPMSVSAVVNGGGRGTRYVSSEARERILRAAEELGYRRNGSAAATATGRFGSVALLTSTRPHHSHHPHNLLHGINAALSAHDLHLMLANLPDEKLTDESFVPKILREWMADGLLIDYIQDIPQRFLEIIERHQIPAVWLNTNQDWDCVRPDDFEAGKRATRHFLELGHTRVAFADFSHSSHLEREHYSAGDRCNGYEFEMKNANLEPQIVRGQDDSIKPPDWLDVCAQVLQSPNRPTAVVCYGRELAPFAMAAVQLGWQVPRDLSLLNFSPQESEFAGLPLTALVNPDDEMGRLAVEMLRQKIAAPGQKFPTRTVPFGFSAGATCAPFLV